MPVERAFGLAGGTGRWAVLAFLGARDLGTSGDQGPAARRPGAGRAVPAARTTWRRRHGRGVPGEVARRAAGRDQADPARTGRRARVPLPVRERDLRREE